MSLPSHFELIDMTTKQNLVFNGRMSIRRETSHATSGNLKQLQWWGIYKAYFRTKVAFITWEVHYTFR